ncbi:MAG: hypothetical protein GEV03_15070 [Streptosporangiales bacterium]|nr:hypothetical protein [Streptosporangiales bacterium]
MSTRPTRRSARGCSRSAGAGERRVSDAREASAGTAHGENPPSGRRSEQSQQVSARRDVVVGGVVFVLALGYVAAALRIPAPSTGSAAGLGPDVVPLVIGLALAAASAALAAQGLLAARTGGGVGGGSPEDAEERPENARKLIVVAMMLLGYILVFIPIGYLLSTFAFLLAATTFLDRAHWRRNVAYAVVFPLVVYLVFTRGLQVQLPFGILGF